MILNTKKKTLAWILTGAALTGCGSRFEVEQQLQKTIDLNASAKSHVEWETSSEHPNQVFARWLFAGKKSDDVCASFEKRTDQELTLFEEQIRARDYATVLAACREELQRRLTLYWAKANASLARIPKVRFEPEVVERDLSQGLFLVTGDLEPKQVILTLDDGPHPEYTPTILKSLSAANARATFFHMGRAVKKYGDVVKQVARGGHAIGTHSFTHRCIGSRPNCKSANGRLLTFEEGVKEIRTAHQAVFDLLGWVDPFFRFPYGESSPELRKYLRENQMAEWFWSTDSEDWKAQPVENIVPRIMKSLEKNRRGIILLHDVQQRTALIMPSLLKELYFNGYRVVTFKSSDPKARTQSKIVNLRKQ